MEFPREPLWQAHVASAPPVSGRMKVWGEMAKGRKEQKTKIAIHKVDKEIPKVPDSWKDEKGTEYERAAKNNKDEDCKKGKWGNA